MAARQTAKAQGPNHPTNRQAPRPETPQSPKPTHQRAIKEESKAANRDRADHHVHSCCNTSMPQPIYL